MTLKKLVMIGAVLATALGAGVSQAKADVFHANAGPARGYYMGRAPRAEWRGRPYYYRRRAVVVPTVNYGYGYGYSYPVANTQDPALFATQIRAEADQAATDLQFDVRQGAVEPQAIASLNADRQEIERDLAEASAKGYITADDRAHLEAHVQEIRDLRSQFRCANQAQASYGASYGY
jgi:hypothetical protein